MGEGDLTIFGKLSNLNPRTRHAKHFFRCLDTLIFKFFLRYYMYTL